MEDKIGWNQRKLQLLKLLDVEGNLTAENVEKSLNITVQNAQMILHRCLHQGLVDLEKPKGKAFRKPAYHYRLNERGRLRMRFLEEKAKEQ